MNNFHIDSSISKAKTIKTEFYTNPSFFEIAKEKIFANSWQYIGDANEVSNIGDSKPIVLLEGYINEPLLIVRDRDLNINCMSNVCTHRGNLLVTKKCKIRNLTCKYHGRQFDLKGNFQFMPEFKEVQNFPTEEDNLHQLPIFSWGDLLFTSLNSKLIESDFFEEMRQRLSWYPIEKLKLKHDLSSEYHVHANWALYCENYLEGFHIPFVHAGLNTVLDFSEYTTEVFPNSNLQIGIAKPGEPSFDLPETSSDYGKNIAAYYFWVFPNMMFNFYPWGLSLNVVQPIGVSETKVNFYSYVLDESKLNLGAGSGLDTVELEDEEIVENVQKGVRSRFYNQGRYSVTREQGTHHFHSLLAKFMQ
jgi:choline monooxygenase